MKGLLLRLSALDADAENAVRVIGFFDALIAARATLHTLVRETARLAECPAGVADTALGVTLRADAVGRVESGVREPESAAVTEPAPGSRVWLERAGPPLPLDAIVLERFAIAAALTLEHARGPLPETGDAALVELALSANAGEAERSRAVRLLRLEPDAAVRVLAVAGDVTPVAELLAALRRADAGVRAAPFGAVHAVVAGALPRGLTTDVPAGVRIGVGPALPAAQAPESWRQARTALRFASQATPYPAVVSAESLGSLAVLAARLRPEDLADVGDLAALDRLAAEPHGADLISVLTVFCVTGSTRKTAAAVYRHHSTVAARLAHAESRLGFSFTAPGGRLRLELALLLRHLRDVPE
jgi:hypothetical protein